MKVEILQYNEPERFKWSMETFPNQTAEGSLSHFLAEVGEMRDAIEEGSDPLEEMADVQMMFWDFVQRSGVSLEELFTSMHRKFEICKTRTWERNEHGYHSHVE